MNNDAFNKILYIFGCFVTAWNILSVLSCMLATIRQGRKAMNTNGGKVEISFQFIFLLVCVCLLFGNILASIRFYEQWIVKNNYSSLDMMLNAFGDRIFMAMGAFGLAIMSLFRISFQRVPRNQR